MKKAVQAMRLAHAIKSYTTSFHAALIAAWKIVKEGVVTFVKETGEIRTACIKSFTTIERGKGFAKFIEINSDGIEQFRSLRFERLIV